MFYRPLIVGFGVVGQAMAAQMAGRGYSPVIVEDSLNAEKRAIAIELGVTLVEAPDRVELDQALDASTVLLPSPGIPDSHPVFALAAQRKMKTLSEFDLARQWDKRPLVAITGTNGKTSVTMMVTDALNRSGVRSAAVGNTEVPLISALADRTIQTFVVEASSFRLGHTRRFEPQVATWLNFAPDHLDAHRSLEDYEAAKASIWSHLPPGAVAIGNVDDEVVSRHLSAMGSCPDVKSQFFSLVDTTVEWHLDGESLVGPDGPFMAVDDLKRSRPHDIANALAAIATSTAAGADIGAGVEAARNFSGLEHRLQSVGVYKGVEWFNDSKATVPQATLAAVGGFSSVVLIAGGKNKGLDLSELARSAPPVRHVVAIGDAGPEIQNVFRDIVEVSTANSMDEAVQQARRVAVDGDSVLLSPGCTSFDWYQSYVERGVHFTQLVKHMIGSA